MSVSSVPRRAVLRVLSAAPAAVLLAACGQGSPAFKGSDITGTHLGKGLSMVDQDGRPRTLADYAGKVLVVFFGYTQCPDVCPTSLAELAQVMQVLGSDASRVQVVMITVDPERDTPEVMKQYVQTFNPAFVGLTGTPEQVKQAAASFKVYYAKVPAKNGKDYSMDHSAAFYLLDAKGEARVLAGNGTDVDSLAHDIKALLA
jgi:protein SCO1/2